MRAFIGKSRLGGWTARFVDDADRTVIFMRVDSYEAAVACCDFTMGKLAR